MILFNKQLTLIFLLLATVSCTKNCEKKEAKITKINYNVLLVPDLSNRINHNIHPKPLEDTLILNTIIDSIPSFLKTGNRTLNQLDTYKIDFINRGILNDSIFKNSNFNISLQKFKNKLQEASEYKRYRLSGDISELKKQSANLYEYAQKHSSGSDVWNYFNETIHSSLVNENPTGQSLDNTSIIYKTKNIVVLLTDGYIETINKTEGYSLNQDLIAKIRRVFLASGSKDLKKFILSNPQFSINKTDNSLQNSDILILEVNDRSLDANGVARFHPTDFEIIRIIWIDWLRRSGAGRIEIHSALSNKRESFVILKDFIEKK